VQSQIRKLFSPHIVHDFDDFVIGAEPESDFRSPVGFELRRIVRDLEYFLTRFGQ